MRISLILPLSCGNQIMTFFSNVNLFLCYDISLREVTIIFLQALHHPFTAPNPEDINDLSSARALAYDMVYNGVEVHEFVFSLRVSSVIEDNNVMKINYILLLPYILN